MTTVTKEPSMYKRALLALVAACGYQDPVAEQPDAPVPVDGESDAPPDVPQALGAFGAPQFVAELNTVANERRASVTADELLLVLDSERGNAGRDLYFSTRSSTSMPWSAPVAIAELNTSEFDAQAIISADGLAIYFAHGPTVGDRDLFVATRASRSAPFGPPTLLDEASSTTEDNDPWISADQRTLLFASMRSGNRDIYIATR